MPISYYSDNIRNNSVFHLNGTIIAAIINMFAGSLKSQRLSIIVAYYVSVCEIKTIFENI